MERVEGPNGRYLGRVYKTPSAWVAEPYLSQVALIPCNSQDEAIQTVKRLGTEAR
ncbi:hypothetical protein LCGC14_1697180 [marine sediment metagenome]|uniref:Uncharacterized protein n=1 Tax=marine sediment metagenome TaxID=412755 RepID=A0A0F9HIV3_9ZZZZ